MKKSLLFVFLFCLCVLMCACEASKAKSISWKPVYNAHDVCGMQASRALPEGITKREMTKEEVASVVPASLLADSEIAGVILFKSDQSLYYMSLQMVQGEYTASILLGEDVSWGGCCMSVAYDGYAEATCRCGETEYALFRDEGAIPMLLGCGKINDIPILVRMHADDLEEIQPMFETILENFARYQQKSLDISGLKP